MGKELSSRAFINFRIPIIALTDLAFSLDSVTTAMAICSETWLIVFGGIIGIITLRLSAGLFLSLLDKFVYLQDSAYIIILGIGLKLLAKALLPSYILPDSLVFSLILLLFIWGFSKGFEPKESGIN
ncbi:TerC family protein [Gloeothece citriformis]